MEEEEAEIPSPLEVGVGGGFTDDLELEFGSNEERAIVLFKPVNESPLLRSSPSNISFSVDSEILSGFKSKRPKTLPFYYIHSFETFLLVHSFFVDSSEFN